MRFCDHYLLPQNDKAISNAVEQKAVFEAGDQMARMPCVSCITPLSPFPFTKRSAVTIKTHEGMCLAAQMCTDIKKLSH